MAEGNTQQQDQVPPTLPPHGKSKNTLLIVLLVLVGAVVVGGGLFAIVMIPAINRAREISNTTQEGANLKLISTSLLIYAQSYDDKFPPHVGILINEGALQPKHLVSPNHSADNFPAYNGEQPTDHYTFGDFHFTYDSNRGARMAGSSIVAYGKAHKNGERFVLFADSSVQGMPDSEFLEHVRIDNERYRRGGQLVDPNAFGDFAPEPGAGSNY